MTTENLSTQPFDSATDVLLLYKEFFFILCIKCMIDAPDVMIDDMGSYAPRRVAFREILAQLTGEPSSQAIAWLGERKFPKPEDIQAMAEALWANIEIRTKATRKAFESQEFLAQIMPLDVLRSLFELSDSETIILAFLALIQSDESAARAYHYTTGEDWGTLPNVSFFQRCLSFLGMQAQTFRHIFSDDAPLMRYALIQKRFSELWNEETPLFQTSICLPRSVLSFLLQDEEISSQSVPVKCYKQKRSNQDKSIDDKWESCRIKLQKAFQSPHSMNLFSGNTRRTDILEMAAQGASRSLRILDARQIQMQYSDGDISPLLRDLLMMRGILVLKWKDEDEEWWKLHAARIHERLYMEPKLHFCLAADRQTLLTRAAFGDLVEIECPPPTQSDQERLWQTSLSREMSSLQARELAQKMAIGYCLSEPEIDDAIEQTLAGHPGQDLTCESLTHTLNRSRGRALEGLATLRSTNLTLDDIVLPNDTRATLEEVLAYARYRDTVMYQWGFEKYNASGAGLCVLLSGVPGTGKTLTALVIGRELRRAVYVVDLSRVVDKYIGETEKKLAAIFDEAERSQAVLLFDEADSLFAKRTNVKSSNDRYANLEVNYLLQRLEAYRGVSIMTTNFSDGLDEALSRRIPFKIHFPMPDAKQRAALWERLIPPGAPTADDIDFSVLGDYFEMSGGHIKNAVFRAAVRAATLKTAISHDMLYDAALQEYREMGHIIRDNMYEREVDYT